MRAPDWIRNHRRGIFQAGIIVYLLLVAAGAGALAEDHGLSLPEGLGVGAAALIPLLFVVGGRNTVYVRAVAAVQSVEDQPTREVSRSASVFRLPARGRFQTPPTTYRAGEVPPAIPIQSRRPAEPDTDPRLLESPPRAEADDVLRTALREDTGGYPPVWGDWEEAT
jgi:hypothetical protein